LTSIDVSILSQVAKFNAICQSATIGTSTDRTIGVWYATPLVGSLLDLVDP
jgi:hypothetical protein